MNGSPPAPATAVAPPRAIVDTVAEPPSRADFAAGVWRLADPKITMASMASIFLGASAAAAAGPLDWPWLGLTVLGIFGLEVAKNASGELFDFDSGADAAVAEEDRSPFSGGKRVLVDGLLTRGQTKGIAWVSYLLGSAVGVAIALLREPSVLWLGLSGVACAYFYHAPPLKLSYRGLGELAVGVCYGPLICLGTYLVQRGGPDPRIALLALPLGLLISAFLWVNEFPDFRADGGAGKRTLVVRLGRPTASRVFAGIVGLAVLGVLLLPLAGLPGGVRWGALAAVPGAAAAWILLRHPETTARIIPAQTLSLAAFLVMALGTGFGLILAG